jgi:aryl-alcohol dehydrogenase-like predicted oxidoreductase
MRYRTLGATGIQVTPYCLGALMFGSIGNPDHDDSIRIILRALDAGINFIDTADMYSRGESELIVGNALNGRRDNVVVATKVNGPMGEDPNMRGTSRRWIITAVEDPCAGCRPSISISTTPTGWTRRSTRRRPFRP